MRVPVPLSEAFGEPFDRLLASFALERGWLPEEGALTSDRFLNRSVVPHIQRLSDLFNRLEDEPEEEEQDAPAAGRVPVKPRARRANQAKDLAPYWGDSSNPVNQRLAYFLYFMPANLYRVASVWAELGRLGFRWAAGDALRAVEFGAGPAAGACGIAAGERFGSVGLPPTGNWALIEQDRTMLEAGAEWAPRFFQDQGFPEWGTRAFCRRVELGGKPRDAKAAGGKGGARESATGFLPRTAPSFNLWVMSYFLNESPLPAEVLARELVAGWERHLDEEGVAVLVEPALKLQSRKILELRRELLKLADSGKAPWLKVLLPCLGHQACGALAAPEDWCHEEVSWWRPPLIRRVDQLAGLDRRTLPFSYLVVCKSRRSHEELLPLLAGHQAGSRYRLVSPSHWEGKDQEFFVCGQEGKRRARYRPESSETVDAGGDRVSRGDLLLGAELRGDVHASRVQSVAKIG